jgi:glyoxylase-like metal-dependent hydrolase (beta-lactamase superfamily II)
MHENITKHAARLLLLCLLLLHVSIATRAQEPAEPPFTLKQIGPNVWAAMSNAKSKLPTGANAGFVIGDNGVAIIDTFASVDGNGELGAGAAQQLLAEIRRLTKLPIKYVINTHYHLDHVGGNTVFADAGAVMVAHQNVRGWIHTENLKFFGKEIKPSQKNFVEGLAVPAVGYDQALDLYMGSREIRVRSFLGHTGGDSVVLIPDAKIAFLGDLFWRRTLPNLIDASTMPWMDSLDTITKAFPDYTVVPGHGDLARAPDLTEFRDYLATLRKLVAEEQARGKSGTSLIEAVTPALENKYGKWDYFKYMVERNIPETEAELNGTKAVPRAQR